ncbi:MAG: M23 family metallopeptidase [bacterium]|nr:M23 family metallopeptidase [bacterium]
MNRQQTLIYITRSSSVLAALFCIMCNQSATFNKEFSVLSLEPRTAQATTEKAPAFGWPVSAVLVSSGFGPRWGDEHKGLDLVAKPGTPIMASADGVVVYAGYERRGYGNLIVIEHNENTQTVYAHNRRNIVQKGQRVKQGQTIAFMGHTGLAFGTHLHFEYRVNGEAANPELYLDPLCAPTGKRWDRARCEELVAAR